MTLTVVVGSSGSGKTTLLNDVHKNHKGIYIRQFHNVRPYIRVNKIPRFDHTKLPYWDLYKDTDPDIMIGGTMSGQFTAGLSGGQRKLMLFELIHQRIMTEEQKDLLVVLDEPFAGVTDDFVPFIVKCLNDMRSKHNVLLVTNDHVSTLTKMADNTIRVSAIDRSIVHLNEHPIPRDVLIAAVSKGSTYTFPTSADDTSFFIDTEILGTNGLMPVAIFTLCSMALLIVSYWNSQPGSEGLCMVAVQIIAFFCLNPYLIALPDWRNMMIEESEALMHSSMQMNKAFKAGLTLILLIVISCIAYGVIQIIIDTLSGVDFFIGMLFDSASLTIPFICLGIYSPLPLQVLQILASLPFLTMIFFSTTFSPGSGVTLIKELRFLYPRFYLWCMIPGFQENMEGCPESLNLLYAVLSGCIGLFLFLIVMGVRSLRSQQEKKASLSALEDIKKTDDYKKVQLEMFGTGNCVTPISAASEESTPDTASGQPDLEQGSAKSNL